MQHIPCLKIFARSGRAPETVPGSGLSQVMLTRVLLLAAPPPRPTGFVQACRFKSAQSTSRLTQIFFAMTHDF
jgi:hypothetical protein